MGVIAENIFETVKSMTDQQAEEVLDFAEFLKTRQANKLLQESIPAEDTDDWSEFEDFAGAWTGKLNREECYDFQCL